MDTDFFEDEAGRLAITVLKHMIRTSAVTIEKVEEAIAQTVGGASNQTIAIASTLLEQIEGKG